MQKLNRMLTAILLPALLLTACSGKSDNKEKEGTPVSANTAPAIGAFEGVMTMKTTIPEAGSTESKIYIGKQGFRSETKANVKGAPEGMQVAVLSRSETPNLAYMINDANKTYMVIDINKMQEERANKPEEDPFRDVKIENLGKETVNGYNCTHIRITNGTDVTEMWMSKDILDYTAYARMQSAKEKNMSTLARKLKDGGFEGFPVKTWHKQSNVTSELTSVERKSLDNSLFEIPAGYTKNEMPVIGKEGMTPQNMSKMQEMARKMQEQTKSQGK